MKPFRSICFNLAMYAVTALMCLMMIWVLPLSRRYMLKVVHIWLGQVAWVEKNIGHMNYKVIGMEHVPSGSCIIASKHQSTWETFKLHLLFGDPAIVLKRELLNIPVWGWYLRSAGMIPIDRKAGAAVLSGMLDTARQAVADGRKIVIFPQGTRIKPLEPRPYKSGVATLYQELGLPVIPMALNSGVFWPKHSFTKKTGTITIEFLPPIMPGLPREEFMAQLKQGLEETSDRLAREVGA